MCDEDAFTSRALSPDRINSSHPYKMTRNDTRHQPKALDTGQLLLDAHDTGQKRESRMIAGSKGKVDSFTCGPSKISLLVGKLEDTAKEYCDIDDIECTDITDAY